MRKIQHFKEHISFIETNAAITSTSKKRLKCTWTAADSDTEEEEAAAAEVGVAVVLEGTGESIGKGRNPSSEAFLLHPRPL